MLRTLYDDKPVLNLLNYMSNVASFLPRLRCCHQFYIHGSVHRDSILIRSNKMQQYAGIYLLQSHSTCFGCPSYSSSGVHSL